MLSRLKISQKIYFLGTVQLLLMLAMGIVSFSQMDKVGAELVDIAEMDIPLTTKITKIAEHQLEHAILFERSLLKASLSESSTQGAQQEFIALSRDIASSNTKISKEFALAQKFINDSSNKLHSEKAKVSYKQLSTQLTKTKAEFQFLAQEVDNVLSQTSQSKIAELHQEIKNVEIHEDEIKLSIIELLDDIQALTLAAAKKAEQDEKSGINLISYLFIGAVIVGALFPIVISRSITTPLNLLKERLNEVNQGDGDLNVILDDKGRDETAEVAKAFNQFLATLKYTIQDTNKQASELGESSDLATEIMQTTLANIESQQMETEMVSTAVQEMSSTTADVASNALSASAVTENVREKVMQGKTGAGETQDIIQRLAQEIEEAAEVIESLVSETNNIGSVLNSIQGIAEQTNLLALNAAIEAARAGESGRGFAVVADEVRTLAQRTQTSTVDIQSLVERLQNEARNAVNSMKKGTDSAEQCLEKSGETSTIF
jgi:methyl-accepting chemotaxis protein